MSIAIRHQARLKLFFGRSIYKSAWYNQLPISSQNCFHFFAPTLIWLLPPLMFGIPPQTSWCTPPKRLRGSHPISCGLPTIYAKIVVTGARADMGNAQADSDHGGASRRLRAIRPSRESGCADSRRVRPSRRHCHSGPHRDLGIELKNGGRVRNEK